MATWLDWFTLTSKAALMQRLADLVRTGHHLYVTGVIPREKAGYFAAKMDALYSVGQDRLTASRQRKRGAATFRLLMLALDDGGPLHWWLLRTLGTAPPEAERERWRDALSDRITLTGYELVRLTRPGAKAPAWTWRYTKDREADLRNALLRAIRTRRDDELRQMIYTIWRTPGFAAARAQVKKIRALIIGEWKRSRGRDPLPEIPSRLGYVRRLPDLGRRLSDLGVKKRAVRKSDKPERGRPHKSRSPGCW